jgi:hypothetical protein
MSLDLDGFLMSMEFLGTVAGIVAAVLSALFSAFFGKAIGATGA